MRHPVSEHIIYIREVGMSRIPHIQHFEPISTYLKGEEFCLLRRVLLSGHHL